jgi:hypothetical protein
MDSQISDTCWQTELPCSCEQGRQAKAFVVNSLRVSLPSASHTLTPLVSAVLSLLAALLAPDMFPRNMCVAVGASKSICGGRGAGMDTRIREPGAGLHRNVAPARLAAVLAVIAAMVDVSIALNSFAADLVPSTGVHGHTTIDTCWQTELPCSCEQGRQPRPSWSTACACRCQVRRIR